MNERFVRMMFDARRARTQGPDATEQRQRTRLAEIVAYARAHSPYYRKRYKDLPDRVEDPTLLPVSSKKELMAKFDDWVTDRDVTIEKVRAFMSNPHLIGQRLLDTYTPLTTSGTTGTPGVFVLDDYTMAVTNVLVLRMLGAWLRISDVFRIIARGGRVTVVCATGGPALAVERGRSSGSMEVCLEHGEGTQNTQHPEGT
jgi:phenylacetate-coenzyme A ligase PaaK-like adenylate-forming protein